MMVKEIPPAFSYGPGPQVELVKAASDGLYGRDFANFVKRAGHPLADWVRQHPAAPGETLVHLIALGSTEKYGPNRNSDGYGRVFLRDRHPTFEKYARFYRDHKSSDPSVSYGLVKKAHYNDELERVELIVALNRTKEAAERNGGKVADYEHDLLESGRDLAVSQAVKIAFDVCNACHNKARHRGEYCGPEQCPKYGGCRDNLGRVYDDGFHLFVDNPNGDFYDISNVTRTRGADRTAFATGKVSQAEREIGGAEAAERLGLVAPVYLLEPQVRNALKAASVLADAEATLSRQPAVSFAAMLAARAPHEPLEFPSKNASSRERRQFLSDAARAGLLLPPAEWLATCSGVETEKCAAFWGDTRLSARQLIAHPHRADILAEQALAPAGDPVRFFSYSPTKKSAERAAWKAAAELDTPRSAPKGPENAVKAASVCYLAYQANVLAAHTGSTIFPLILADAVRHNRTQSVQ